MMNFLRVTLTFVFTFNVFAVAKIDDETRAIGFGALEEEWRVQIEQMSWRPRAFHIKGLLTDEECDHLIALAKPTMMESNVVDTETGKSVKSEVRTSSGTFLTINHDSIVHSVEERVARITMLPIEHQEGLQILRYENGQKYEPHWDFFIDDFNGREGNGGQRTVTVLMYLTNVKEGGETVLPNAEHKVSGPGWSDCARKGLAIHPNRGDALMFYSLFPNGTKDESSLHGSCPTIKGVKWSATKWIHVLPLYPPMEDDTSDLAGCKDVYDECEAVAKEGRCEKDEDTRSKYCKKSCNACIT